MNVNNLLHARALFDIEPMWGSGKFTWGVVIFRVIFQQNRESRNKKLILDFTQFKVE